MTKKKKVMQISSYVPLLINYKNASEEATSLGKFIIKDITKY